MLPWQYIHVVAKDPYLNIMLCSPFLYIPVLKLQQAQRHLSAYFQCALFSRSKGALHFIGWPQHLRGGSWDRKRGSLLQSGTVEAPAGRMARISRYDIRLKFYRQLSIPQMLTGARACPVPSLHCFMFRRFCRQTLPERGNKLRKTCPLSIVQLAAQCGVRMY
jgi:hypothetical protein